jgi:hypothetical protein
MNGTLMGRPTMHTVEAKWVLNHQFLGIHEWRPPDPRDWQAAIRSDARNRL